MVFYNFKDVITVTYRNNSIIIEMTEADYWRVKQINDCLLDIQCNSKRWVYLKVYKSHDDKGYHNLINKMELICDGHTRIWW